MRGPLKRYRELVASGALAPDAAQEAAMTRLQALEFALAGRRTSLFACTRSATPQGVYLWGGVGRGKTVLMDLFFNNSHAHPRRRVHFHEFMAETHERIARWRAIPERAKRRHKGASRKSIDDPMAPVAHDIAREAHVLCFDEFHVNDIADAMILGRLFDGLFANNVVIVATSNRRPDDLYPGGINRRLFLPFIETLKSRLDIFELKAARDYRLAQLSGAPVYYSPFGPRTDDAIDAAWERFICGGREHVDKIEIKGRTLKIPRTARGAARFEFGALCAQPLGAGDYLAIARRYGTLFIDHIPRMGAAMRNEAKRFVTLIDMLYEMNTKLVCSADGEPDELCSDGDAAFEFARAASRLMEMRSEAYLAAERRDEAEQIAAE